MARPGRVGGFFRVLVAALFLATASSPGWASQAAPTPSPMAPAEPAWQFAGDFRVRYELTTARPV